MFSPLEEPDALARLARRLYNRRMDCPACKAPLMALEYDGVEVDHCVACGGVWLDAGEIELLFGDDEEVHSLFKALDPGHLELDRKIRCPISGKPMRKGRMDAQPPITVDYSDHGIWFDRGELAAALSASEATPGIERITAWLNQVFPMKRASTNG